MAKPTKKKSAEEVAGVAAQIRVDAKPDTPWYYVNYIGVGHSPYDFTISAIKVPSPFTEEQMEFARNGESIPLEPVVQIVIPPLLVDGLIYALTEQKSHYEKTLAQQVRNNESQHKHLKGTDSVH
jgi:hypothetical protein